MGTAALPAELGPTLRAWRERAAVPEAALQDPAVRHTPGLRREELAALAGVSTDYIIQIEQGRARTPSEQVLRAITRALGLSDPGRDHLYELAGLLPPPPSPQLPPAAVQMIPQLQLPAALCNGAWDLVTWNAAWTNLHGDARGLPLNERNIVLRHFWNRPAPYRRNEAQAAAFESGIVADLRRSLGRNQDDPRLAAVIGTLLETSARFRALWAAPVASPYDHELKTFHDAEFGSYELDCMVMDTRHLDYRVILISAAPGSVGEARLRRNLHTLQPVAQ
jgi:transcriptional regulator with XRE-family HTH domain